MRCAKLAKKKFCWILHNTCMQSVSPRIPYLFLSISISMERTNAYVFAYACVHVCVCVCSRNDFGALHHIFLCSFFVRSLPNVTTPSHGVCDFSCDVAVHCSFVRCVLILLQLARCATTVLCDILFAPALYVNLVYSPFVLSSCYVNRECVRYSELLQRNRTYVAFCVCSFTKRTFNLFFFILKTKSIICFYVVFFSFLVFHRSVPSCFSLVSNIRLFFRWNFDFAIPPNNNHKKKTPNEEKN